MVPGADKEGHSIIPVVSVSCLCINTYQELNASVHDVSTRSISCALSVDLLTKDDTKLLAQVSVSIRVHYCKTILFSVQLPQLHPFQSVLNAAAHLKKRKFVIIHSGS